MLFSIVVPIYNAEAYLQACIESVLTQTCGALELLLVDDGSTDGCGEICDAAAKADARVRVLHRQNQGPIAARRAGIMEAGGDYTLFADADDLLMPGALERLRRCIAETGADLVIYNNVSRFENGVDAPTPPVFPAGSVFFGEDDKAKWVYRTLIESWKLNNLWIKAIRTPLLQEDDTDYERFYDNPNADDLLMTLYPVTHAKRIAYLDQPLYIYRRVPGSISSRVLTGRIDRQFNAPVMDRLRRYMTVWGMDTPEWLKRYHSRRLFGLISLFWQHYRAADSYAARRLIIDYPWEAHIPDEGRQYLQDNTLGRAKQMQLNAILSRNKPLIDLFARVGTLRMHVRSEK